MRGSIVCGLDGCPCILESSINWRSLKAFGLKFFDSSKVYPFDIIFLASAFVCSNCLINSELSLLVTSASVGNESIYFTMRYDIIIVNAK